MHVWGDVQLENVDFMVFIWLLNFQVSYPESTFLEVNWFCCLSGVGGGKANSGTHCVHHIVFRGLLYLYMYVTWKACSWPFSKQFADILGGRAVGKAPFLESQKSYDKQSFIEKLMGLKQQGLGRRFLDIAKFAASVIKMFKTIIGRAETRQHVILPWKLTLVKHRIKASQSNPNGKFSAKSWRLVNKPSAQLIWLMLNTAFSQPFSTGVLSVSWYGCTITHPLILHMLRLGRGMMATAQAYKSHQENAAPFQHFHTGT